MTNFAVVPPVVLDLLLLAVAAALAVAWGRARRTAQSLAAELEAARHQQHQGAVELNQRSALDTLKDEFVSTVSHELRTPLTSIRGALGLLSAGVLGEVDPRAQNLLRIAVTNTDRLIRLINDILDLERMESGRAPLQIKRCSLPELVEQAVETMEPMADAAGVTLCIEEPPSTSMPPIYFDGDPDRMLQVLTNLLSNAIKFSPPASTITIQLETPSDALLVKVVDEGRGIPEGQLEAVFERFKQVESADARQRGGTGLGLAICRTIVQQHGGTIWAQRNAERGVSICIRLPRQQRASDRSERVRPVITRMPEGSILICDDDAVLRTTIAEQLRGRGYTVLEACSSDEAVTIASERAPKSPVRAILLDMNMTDMKGWELLKRLTQDPATAAIPLVMLSVQSPAGDAERSSEERGKLQGWIQKPINEDRLFAELGNALSSGTRPGYVLLVEDDQDLASVVIAGFEKTEVRVDHASTRHEAMLMCQQRRPDLMILDLTLPDGDGFSLVDWLRGQPGLQALPLVVYSGREVSSQERVKLRLGPTKFLTKAKVQTSDVEELVLAMVHRRLKRRATDAVEEASGSPEGRA